ncbi:DUF423 domain-containing protein [Thalassotalea piscium]|uniref:Uncharacterized membrane protein YgdD (TMEM256/DUF423 family) n=1 Tax=Thalassotalea piscium TaxID=1230533 RepID=A0A7X0TUA7_9GAMM|nr:DUF423 domain-containing protein [Thalassotalea piscium]MBB6544126.1 uncharacterized membrane protein YgdD (TMEM256/DUF423 family) [Thalassotalea piscium]
MNIAKTSRILVIFVAISGCFSVLFGAWLSHAAQSLVAEQLHRVEIAHQYQMLHTLALLAVIVWYKVDNTKLLLFSALSFATGILLFCGSLYLKSFFSLSTIGNLAPLGGILLALGWLLLIFVGKNKL